MQEVAYNILTRLSVGLHRKSKAPWPMLLMQIGLYVIGSLKEVDVEVEDFKKLNSTLEVSTRTTHMFYAGTIVRECAILGSTRRVIGQRKIHGDIVTTPLGSRNRSTL